MCGWCEGGVRVWVVYVCVGCESGDGVRPPTPSHDRPHPHTTRTLTSTPHSQPTHSFITRTLTPPPHSNTPTPPAPSHLHQPHTHSPHTLTPTAHSHHPHTHTTHTLATPGMHHAHVRARLQRRANGYLTKNAQRFRGGFGFKVHGLLYHSTLGWRAIKKKK